MIQKRFTPEQLCDAEQLLKIINEVPAEKRPIVLMMTSAFISGMEAQENIAAVARNVN